MYLLNPLAFARDLQADRVTEGVKARYLILGGMVQYTDAVWRSGSGARHTSPIATAIVAALFVAGVYVCFRANAAGDGRRFVERFVCLGATLNFWTFLAGILVGVLLFHGAGVQSETYRVIAGGYSLLNWMVYFATLRWLILHASKNNASHPPPLPRVA